MADWTLTTTGYTFAGKTVEEIRDICQAAELVGIEGAPPLFQRLSDAEIESYRTTIQDAGLRITTFHLPFSAADDIASFYNTQREAAVATMLQWMKRAALGGASVGIQHPTTTRYDVAKEGLKRYLGHIGKSLEALLPEAERLGFTIAVENMLPGDGDSFCSMPEHVSCIVERFDHPNLGFCLDTGHTLVSLGDGAFRMQDAMGSRLAAYHLADNAGDSGMSFMNMPVLVGKRPVNRAALAGVQTGDVPMALAKSSDSAASRSMFGVTAFGSPLYPVALARH